MITYTSEQVAALQPCPDWPLERIQTVFAAHGRQGQAVPLLDILRWEDVPAGDRIWVGIRRGEHVGPFAARVVDRVVRTHALPHEATKEWATRWLSGEDRSAETAAEAKARAASRASVWAAEAARAASWAAARSVASRAAKASRAASEAAAAEAIEAKAAWAAAEEEERSRQLGELIEEVSRAAEAA